MERTIVLRFRDLVTDPGETIEEHRALLSVRDAVWWGWWMRPYEDVPRALFLELDHRIERQGGILAYLCDTGTSRLYSCRIGAIRVSPSASGISSPQLEKTPQYYQRSKHRAWFLLKESLDDQPFEDLNLVYDSFPTRPDKKDYEETYVGKSVSSAEELRQIDVTLWVVRRAQGA